METGNLGTNGGSQHPTKRRLGGHGPNLADEVEWLLPTPKASDGTKGSPRQRHGNGDMTLPSAAASLLPIPRASDNGTPGRRPGPGWRPPLSAVVLPLWASPNSGPTPDGAATPPPSLAGNPSPDQRPPPPTRAGV